MRRAVIKTIENRRAAYSCPILLNAAPLLVLLLNRLLPCDSNVAPADETPVELSKMLVLEITTLVPAPPAAMPVLTENRKVFSRFKWFWFDGALMAIPAVVQL